MKKIYDEEMDDKKFVKKKKKIIDGEINNKTTFSLKYLADNMTTENINSSLIYEVYGDKKDQAKDSNNMNGISAGRYSDKYIHYLIKNNDLEKYKTKK